MTDDDRELFERALESMSPSDVYRGKFGASAENEAPAEQPQDPGSREEVQRLREQRTMEDAFSGICRIARGKYHAAPPKDDATDTAQDALIAEFEAALAPPEPEPVPAEPAVSLELSAPLDIHTLNLRGLDPGKALGQLGLFMDLAAKDRRELVRIRVGSKPGLLKAITIWFTDVGIGYIDSFETTQAHADAAIFARIRHTEKVDSDAPIL